MEKAVLGTILPLQGFLSKPVTFPEAAQIDRFSIGLLPGHINLAREQKSRRRMVRSKISVTGRKIDGSE